MVVPASETRGLKRKLKSPPRSLVKLVIGKDQIEYLAFAERLEACSPFFAAALSSKWKEGQERRVVLPDDDSETVHLYTEWVNADRIFVHPSAANSEDPNSDEPITLANLWVFGEKIQDRSFQDAVINALWSWVGLETTQYYGRCRYPGGTAVRIAYDGSSPGSQIRKLMAYIYAFGRPGSTILNEDPPADFIHDIARELMEKNKSGEDYAKYLKSSLEDVCRYHQHEEGKCHLAEPEWSS